MATIATSTPERSNDPSVIIITTPRPKSVQTLQIARASKRTKASKKSFVENVSLKYFEETICIFISEKILPRVKKKHFVGCKNSLKHHCSLRSNEDWVVFLLLRINRELRPVEIENTVSIKIRFTTNDDWANKVGAKIIKFVNKCIYLIKNEI